MRSVLKHCSRRLLSCLPMVVAAAAIAGCSSQPTMNPDVVAKIHSGKIVIIMPPGRIFSDNFNNDIWFGVSVYLAGLTGGILYGILESHLPHYQSEIGPDILRQYKSRISATPISGAFVKSIAATTGRVPWAHSDFAVYKKPADAGDMRQMAKRSNVNVVAFVRPWVHFSSSLRKVVLTVFIHVYAREPYAQAAFLSGGTIHVSTDMVATGAPLKQFGFQGIAASDMNDSAALGARANLWFEKGDARFKRAIALDMKKLRPVLANYLNGGRNAN